MSTTPQSVDLPRQLAPRNPAQAELISQLASLHQQLRDLEKAIERVFCDQRRSDDEPRAQTLARSFMSSRTNPFTRLECHRRGIQNQYWKLVRLFYQLAPDEPDDIGEAEDATPPPAPDTSVDLDKPAEEGPAPASDASPGASPSPHSIILQRAQPAPPSPSPTSHAPPLVLPPPSARILRSACARTADTLLHTDRPPPA